MPYDHFHATYLNEEGLTIEVEGGLLPNDPINTGEFKGWTDEHKSAHLQELAENWGVPKGKLVISFRVAG